MKKGLLIAVGALFVIVGLGWWFLRTPAEVAPSSQSPVEEEAADMAAAVAPPAGDAAAGDAAEEPAEESAAEEEPSDGEPAEAPMTEEERQEAEEEQKVEAFDALTDKWVAADEKRQVTMKDADEFVARFKAIPAARQDECIHRALNLVPDENVMLLVGVLMDRTVDKEIVETVYQDVLNRDEDVKRPILKEIFKDKSHPCWKDTAWILDVTDDLPKK